MSRCRIEKSENGQTCNGKCEICTIMNLSKMPRNLYHVSVHKSDAVGFTKNKPTVLMSLFVLKYYVPI